ncbi:MAG: aldehyde dehydrogenase family protein [Alphaproteobacteria bacterium]
MKPALLLVDVQADFLERPGLYPSPAVLTEGCAKLLRGFRALELPVFHVHTLVEPDGHDRMPHWKRADYWACVAGTPGAEPPASLRPSAGEPVIRKTFFSAFASPALADALARQAVDTVVVAGVYLHSCIRATALDAYGHGLEVWIAADAVASTEPLDAVSTRRYLDGRAASFVPIDEVLRRLGGSDWVAAKAAAESLPVAFKDGQWTAAEDQARVEKRNPARWNEIQALVPVATRGDVALACAAAANAAAAWQGTGTNQRLALFAAWAEAVRAVADDLASSIVAETGKPLTHAKGEVARAAALIESAARVFLRDPASTPVGDHVLARRRPHGVVGLITPWNNPVGIPIGKLAPALAAGNAVVWKPALEAPRTAMAVIDTLRAASFPLAAVSLVTGDASTAQHVILDPNVGAVSLTGSHGAGRQAAALCTETAKPLQAELGGNNAAIVTPDCDLPRVADALALSAFGFAGQRCTATRRIIVIDSIRPRFEELLIASIAALRIGQPADPATQVGPLISPQKQAEVERLVARAIEAGAGLLCGGGVPPGLEHGCWYAPALFACADADAELVQQETFGPVAVLQTARDLEQAIVLCNGVPQGLVAALYSDDAAAKRRFAETAQAGLLRFNDFLFDIHPEAPFSGWKASGLGPPEHGAFDREFYSKAQAVYGALD